MGLLPAAQSSPTGGFDGLSRNLPPFLGDQKGDDPGDIGGCSHPTQRQDALDALLSCGSREGPDHLAPTKVPQMFGSHIGSGRARHNGIDGNPP